MMLARSTACFARCIRFAAVAGSLCVASVVLRGERPARACSGGEPNIADFTTFDPGVLGDPNLDPVAYDPYIARFGGYRPGGDADALAADWRGYLAGAVGDPDWRKLLFDASPAELATIHRRLAGKSAAIPRGYERSSLWTAAATPATRDKLAAAVAVVRLARDVEPSAVFYEPWDETRVVRPAPAPGLLQAATAGAVASAADPFLAQRYAFQAVRILFYQHDLPGLIKFFEQHAGALAGPSPALTWRAHYYLAGALGHTGQTARASFELSRVHANYPPLAGPAAGDFAPRSDADWRAALGFATTPREQTELWRLVGVKFDGMAAAREILKLDPTSDLLALLVVRELGRAESTASFEFGTSDEIEQRKRARLHALGEVEQLALEIAAIPGADRPWLMNLVAGHIAAVRGELATARARLQLALAAVPGSAVVRSQVKASLSLALVATWKIDAGHERELAQAMTTLDQAYARAGSVRALVRDQLAKLYLAANRLVDAEYLVPGTIDPGDTYGGFYPHPGPLHWAGIGFIKDMIARRANAATEFDRFVVDQPALPTPNLQQELALRYALDGDFAAATQIFDSKVATSGRLEVDPFVTHIKDCRACDERKYAKAPWTHASVIARLAKLAPVANGTGDAAAEAAIQIGNALYNVTSLGNARRVLRYTHQDTFDERPAERWYRRAYQVAKSRELAAKAAYLAAKTERGNLFDTETTDETRSNNDLPQPASWFSKLKPLSDTKYYKDVLKECGTFQAWVKANP